MAGCSLLLVRPLISPLSVSSSVSLASSPWEPFGFLRLLIISLIWSSHPEQPGSWYYLSQLGWSLWPPEPRKTLGPLVNSPLSPWTSTWKPMSQVQHGDVGAPWCWEPDKGRMNIFSDRCQNPPLHPFTPGYAGCPSLSPQSCLFSALVGDKCCPHI